MTVLVGGYAHKYHMGVKTGVTETVKGWQAHAPGLFPLPHPSWRNTGWIRKNPWFEDDLLPKLRAQVRKVIRWLRPCFDAAHVAMQAEGAEDDARRRFYERLTGTELFLLLEAGAGGRQAFHAACVRADGSFLRAGLRSGAAAEPVHRHNLPLCGTVRDARSARCWRPKGWAWGSTSMWRRPSMLLPPEAVQWLAEMGCHTRTDHRQGSGLCRTEPACRRRSCRYWIRTPCCRRRPGRPRLSGAGHL